METLVVLRASLFLKVMEMLERNHCIVCALGSFQLQNLHYVGDAREVKEGGTHVYLLVDLC